MGSGPVDENHFASNTHRGAGGIEGRQTEEVLSLAKMDVVVFRLESVLVAEEAAVPDTFRLLGLWVPVAPVSLGNDSIFLNNSVTNKQISEGQSNH